MSIKTWKSEFYSTLAETTTPEEALEHSLRKWIGIKKDNLLKHGVSCSKLGTLYDETPNEYFEVGSDSCALCHHFYKPDYDYCDEGTDNCIDPNKCEECPLAQARGNTPCDAEMESESESPWHHWTENKNPDPMLRWLKEAKKIQ